uniref:Major facilitator superfamily (MFS) profile domain-containing protein n=1 Tax=Maylandia zebra TaxID=106582 RepID=A0A3P9C178_9CICH
MGLGGSFQVGFHITGLSSPSPYIQRFINNSWYDRYGEPPHPQTVTMIWSLIVSMFAVGGLFGAISVKFISDLLGRKKAMICNSFIAVLAAGFMLTSKNVNSFEMIIVARFLFGYSAGLGMNTHLIYLGEISPRKIRGIVTLTLATFLSLGKVSGQTFGLREKTIAVRRLRCHVCLLDFCHCHTQPEGKPLPVVGNIILIKVKAM